MVFPVLWVLLITYERSLAGNVILCWPNFTQNLFTVLSMGYAYKPAVRWRIQRRDFRAARSVLYILIITCIIWYLSPSNSSDNISWLVSQDYSKKAGSALQTVLLRNPNACGQTHALVTSLVAETTASMMISKDKSGRANNYGWISANKLIDDKCWTYQDRYAHYHNLPPATKFVNDCHAHLKQPASMAFVIRVGETQFFTEDLILSIRAIIAEIGWKQGIDIFILQYIEDVSESDVSSIPSEFHSLLIRFNRNDLIADYDPRVFEPIASAPIKIPVIAEYNHMAETYFMRSRPQYQHAWFVEADVRLIGRWDTYLDKVEQSMQKNTPPGMTMDLVNFGPSYLATPDWAWGKSLFQFNLPDYTMALLQLHRISRPLINKMHEAHKEGKNAYFEGFATTIATASGLNRFTFVNPVFSNGSDPFAGDPFTGIGDVDIDGDRLQKKNLYMGNLEEFPEKSPRLLYHGATYCPMAKLTKPYYDEWKQNDTVCRAASLVHPVK